MTEQEKLKRADMWIENMRAGTRMVDVAALAGVHVKTVSRWVNQRSPGIMETIHRNLRSPAPPTATTKQVVDGQPWWKPGPALLREVALARAEMQAVLRGGG